MARSARIQYGNASYRDLSAKLKNMEEEERKETRGGVKKSYIAYRASVARENDFTITKAMVYLKMHWGRGTETDSVNDTGCTYPLMTTAVTNALKLEVKPLQGTLEIIDASGNALDVLGTIQMFIDSEILGGRKLVEAAVIEGKKKETLFSLQLLKHWDLHRIWLYRIKNK